MALQLLDAIDVVDLVVFGRAVPNRAEFTLSSVLPDVEVPGLKWRTRSRTRTVRVAKYLPFDVETPIARRDITETVTEGTLPKIGQKFLTTEMETILTYLAAGAGPGTDPVRGELLRSLYDDAESHVTAIRSRLELAKGDTLTDGKFTITAENGWTTEADFLLPGTHKVTAGTLWSNAASTPLTDEQTWRQVLINDLAGPHDRVITSTRVFSYFASNAEYRLAYYGSTPTATTPSLNPMQVNQVRTNYGLPPIQLYDTTVNVDGVTTRPIADNLFLMFAPGEIGQTQYGITAEGLALSAGTKPRIDRRDAPGIVITASEEDDPVRVITKGVAVAMPVLFDPNKQFVATVL